MTDPTHGFTEEELLAFAQGRAPEGLVARIEQAQSQDRMLAAEIALMQGLKPALAEASGGMNPPGELDWRRLKADIQKDAGQPAASSEQPQGGRIVLWQAAAVFFAIVAFGQMAYLSLAPNTADPVYQTATGANAAHVLVIGFAPDASATEIGAVLSAAEARIIDGPGASGLYRIAFEDADALKAGRENLEAAAAVETVLDP